ncbi:MAG: 3-hydroxyacyl-CoA dehydrogenase/enoyl-CoA hydratase family protein [Flavobacteriales bacterium]|nr:3-hydroxyacyl-CoA dehydrogenase/enoyl-CoA hydratase family protein [Flavobacteriales bacterium]
MKINKVGVVGAGTMGSALAQKFAQEGFEVTLADREMSYIERGLSGIREMLNQGVERRLFTSESVEKIIGNIKGTSNLEDLKACDLIIEAVFEDFDVKTNLFKTLDNIVSKDTILATNTSSFSVSELSQAVSKPERFIGVHYFFHAAKNRLVELIPGEKTSEQTYQAMKVFSVLSGKDAITTKDVYGFAVNRFFVPWLNEAVKLLDEGLASIAQIDKVCMRTFGIGMGPFALMNATGVPIALHAQRTLEHFGPSYLVSSLLEKQVESKNNWDCSGTKEAVVDEKITQKINDRMLGSVFFVCSQIIQEEVCTPVDLNRGAKIGLRWRKGPVDLMLRSGENETKRIVENFSRIYAESVPNVDATKWNMEFVTLTKNGKNAIITMNRPEDMNALNEDVMKQLHTKFTQAETDKDIENIILTGSGKAFVAGADIKFFVKNIKTNSIDKIENFTKYGQDVLNQIDKSEKKVVVILNGMALGGGMELALCADVLLSVPKTFIAFPETGIGIYPGLGGTQRTRERIGEGLAKYIVYSGKMLSSKSALAMGLIDGIISPSEMYDMLEGRKELPNKLTQNLSDDLKSIEQFFSEKSVAEILTNNSEEEFSVKMKKTLSYKAPIALILSEKLISQAKGPESELAELRTIFSTEDALLGLTSIGKKVAYKGR